MSIPTVIAGTIQLDSGKVIEFESPSGLKWLDTINSFRFEPSSPTHAYTVRKEPKKGGDYWYGYRKVAGKLHKRYIGKSPELSIARLEDIAEALNIPQQARVTDKVTQVTDTVTDTVTQSRLSALELQVQALQESLEVLREAMPGKLRA